MKLLPKILVSSVVRGAQQGDSHGGLYLVDPNQQSFDQVLDWNSCEINFEGRGADRGLRGISFHDDRIYIAASDELFVFNPRFEIVCSYRNPYLKHCHEIWKHGPNLYLTSTGFDSVLVFNLPAARFVSGIYIFPYGSGIGAKAFDPNGPSGPPPSIGFHFNNVFVDQRGVFVSGRKLKSLLCIRASEISVVARLPFGTHNARPFNDGVLFNDTASDALRWLSSIRRVSLSLPSYPISQLSNVNKDDSKLARQAFGRGLCTLSDTLIAGGSSPTTISLYDLEAEKIVRSINISMDVRNAVHGMAIWPY